MVEINLSLTEDDLSRLADMIAARLEANGNGKPAADEPLLSEGEVAERAGVPKYVIRDARYKRNELRGYKVGRSWKYKWSDVEEWSRNK